MKSSERESVCVKMKLSEMRRREVKSLMVVVVVVMWVCYSGRWLLSPLNHHY